MLILTYDRFKTHYYKNRDESNTKNRVHQESSEALQAPRTPASR